MPEPLTRDRQDQKAGNQRGTKGLGLIMENCVGICRDLSACYVTVATQILGMQKLDAAP